MIVIYLVFKYEDNQQFKSEFKLIVNCLLYNQQVLDLINAMREATKVLNFHSGSNLIQRSGTSNLDNILSNSQQFEVMYVGKIKVIVLNHSILELNNHN